MRILPLAGCMVMMTACAAPPPPKSEPPPTVTAAPTATATAAPKVEAAEMPFTVAEIREGCPPGRRMVFRISEKDKPDVLHTIEFVKSDAAGTDFRTSDADAAGKVVKSADHHATWEELRSHAEFPKDKTAITHRTTVHPLGTLEVIVYKVTEGEGADAEVTTYHFAKKIPGPPITYFTEKNGARLRSSTMETNAMPK